MAHVLNQKNAMQTIPTHFEAASALRKTTEKPTKSRQQFVVEQDTLRFHRVYLGFRQTDCPNRLGLAPGFFYLDIEACSVLAEDTDEQFATVERSRRIFYRRRFDDFDAAKDAFVEKCLPQFKSELRKYIPDVTDVQARGFFDLWVSEDVMSVGRFSCRPRLTFYGYSMKVEPRAS